MIPPKVVYPGTSAIALGCSLPLAPTVILVPRPATA